MPPRARGGKRQGLRCEGGKLWDNTVSTIASAKPKEFMIENVPGMADEKVRPVLDAILVSLEQAGYVVLWALLSSHHFGLPQARTRIYIVGIRRDLVKMVPYAWPSSYPSCLALRSVLGPARSVETINNVVLPPKTEARARGNVIATLDNYAHKSLKKSINNIMQLGMVVDIE